METKKTQQVILRHEGHNHANISRHLLGLKPHYSRKVMRKQLSRLLSVNYLYTSPNPGKHQEN